MLCSPSHARPARGFSLTEMVFVIAVIGILASIAIPQLGDILERSKATAAAERAAWLNSKLHTFFQVYGDIYQTPTAGAGDELIMLRTMQWGDPQKPDPIGLPFVPLTYNPVPSSDSQSYRLQWTGSNYKVLARGDSGTGLLVPMDSSDFTAANTRPSTFKPAGR